MELCVFVPFSSLGKAVLGAAKAFQVVPIFLPVAFRHFYFISVEAMTEQSLRDTTRPVVWLLTLQPQEGSLSLSC